MANANFTPDIGPYTTLKPFRFWCQKVLPLVYDDSLSYYELLGKVVDYLNKTMEDVDTQITDIQGLLSAYEALQSWVNAYYTSADFAAAIDDGLDRMAESGQLTALLNAIIAPQLPDIVDLLLPETVMTLLPDEVSSQIGGTVATQLPGVVSNQIPGTVATQLPAVVSSQIGPVVEDKIVDPVEDWLDANVSGSIAVDRTLSVLGAGADAAFTGARLETLDNTLGYEHVADTGFIITTANPFAFNVEVINDLADFSDSGTHTYKMLVIPVNTGDKYCINAHKISIANISAVHFAVTYAFCAKWVGDPDTDTPYYLPTTYSANDADNVIATVPEIMIPTGQSYDQTTGYLVVITANIEDPVYKVVDEGILKDITDLKSEINKFDQEFVFSEGWINCSNSTTDVTAINANTDISYICSVIPCTPGEIFTISGKCGSLPRLFRFIDATGAGSFRAIAGLTADEFELMAPDYATKLVVNFNSVYNWSIHRGRREREQAGSIKVNFIPGLYHDGADWHDNSAANTYSALFSVSDETPYLKVGGGSGFKAFAFFGTDGRIISQSPSSITYDGVLAIPAGCTYVIAQNANASYTGFECRLYANNDNTVLYPVTNALNKFGTSILDSSVWEAGGFNADGTETASSRIRIKAANSLNIDDYDSIMCLSASLHVQVHLYTSSGSYIGHIKDGGISIKGDYEWKSSYNLIMICKALRGYGVKFRVAVDTSTLSNGDLIAFNRIENGLKDAMDDIDAHLYEVEHNAGIVPSYWKTYIQEKADLINSYLAAAVWNKADAFMFITDIHYPEYTYDGYGDLMRFIHDATPVNKTFVGGDVIQNTTDAAEKYGYVLNELSYDDRVYATPGNHDAGAQTYYLMQKRQENVIVREYDDRYYIDAETQKIRYIVLNSWNPDTGGITASQVSWCEARINELSAGWHYVIITHGLWIAATPPFSELEHTADYDTIVGILDDCQTADANLICVVSGHCHTDYSELTESGYLFIATTCEANGYMAQFDSTQPTRTPGTTTEHAFDCYCINLNTNKINIVRIGAGVDREYSF